MKRVLIAVGAVGFASALAIGLLAFGAKGAQPRNGPLVVHAGGSPPGPFVRGDGFFAHGARSQLAAAVSGAMMGPLAPVAVASSDGAVAYNTWSPARPIDNDRSYSEQGIQNGDVLGIPSLRVREASGKDVQLARGAYSAAWRADGAIAFTAGVDPAFRAGQTYDGQVVVRDGVHGRDVTWTSEPAHYVVYAWAGSRLLFYRVGLGEKLQLLVADGPGKIRPLTDGSAIAVSPDGSRLVVVGQDGTNVRLIDIGSGRERAWLDVTTATPSLRWVAYSGSWVGDHVVAPSSSGLAVFHAGDSALSLEQALSIDQSQFPVGVQEPRFTDAGGNQIAAVVDVPPKAGTAGVSFLLQCDRIQRTCERGRSAPAKDWLRPVDEEGGR